MEGSPLIALIDFYHQVAGAVNSPLIRLRVCPDHTYHPPDRVITAYARAVNHTIRGGWAHTCGAVNHINHMQLHHSPQFMLILEWKLNGNWFLFKNIVWSIIQSVGNFPTCTNAIAVWSQYLHLPSHKIDSDQTKIDSDQTQRYSPKRWRSDATQKSHQSRYQDDLV